MNNNEKENLLRENEFKTIMQTLISETGKVMTKFYKDGLLFVKKSLNLEKAKQLSLLIDLISKRKLQGINIDNFKLDEE
jgi:hypothetical protein